MRSRGICGWFLTGNTNADPSTSRGALRAPLSGRDDSFLGNSAPVGMTYCGSRQLGWGGLLSDKSRGAARIRLQHLLEIAARAIARRAHRWQFLAFDQHP